MGSMGDDDNDLTLAALVGHTYVPGFSADSFRQAVAKNPSAFTVSKAGGFRGTDEILEQVAIDLAGTTQQPVKPTTLAKQITVDLNAGVVVCVALLASLLLLMFTPKAFRK